MPRLSKEAFLAAPVALPQTLAQFAGATAGIGLGATAGYHWAKKTRKPGEELSQAKIFFPTALGANLGTLGVRALTKHSSIGPVSFTSFSDELEKIAFSGLKPVAPKPIGKGIAGAKAPTYSRPMAAQPISPLSGAGPAMPASPTP